MRAWKCVTWGGPGDLELGNMPEPPCLAGHVAIDVEAWAVNFADLVLIAGNYQARPAFPFVPGMEVSGKVSEVGQGVEAFTPGQTVAAYVEHGGYADRVVAPVTNLALMPASVPMPTAAAFPVPYGTAELALERASLGEGEVVVVGGAGGSVGAACVELAKQRGAYVVACAGSAEKQDLARACGADGIVSSHAENLREDIKCAAPNGVDVVLDPIGGGFFEAAYRSLRYGGRLVSLGFASGEIPSAPVNHILVRHISVIGSSFGLTGHKQPERIAGMWPALLSKLVDGRITPRIGATMAFSELPAALRLLEDRKVAGRVVLV